MFAQSVCIKYVLTVCPESLEQQHKKLRVNYKYKYKSQRKESKVSKLNKQLVLLDILSWMWNQVKQNSSIEGNNNHSEERIKLYTTTTTTK